MMERPAPSPGDATSGEARSTREDSSSRENGSDPADAARRAQFLATEHWSLLATRSMSWNEAFSRTSMFLSTLSAAVVALALAGPAMSFGGAFPLFALIVLSVTLFLGVATYVRLLQVNNEDLYWVAGMNMLRGAYTRIAPGVEDNFVTGHTLDPEGIARSFGAFDVTSGAGTLHMLITTPSVVGVISSAIAGVIGGLAVVQLGVDIMLAVAIGIATFIAAVALSLRYALRENRRYIARAIERRLHAAELVDREPRVE